MLTAHFAAPIGLIATVVAAAIVGLWAQQTSPLPAGAQETVVIAVGDNWFCDDSYQNGVVCETIINVGDSVEWDFSGAQQTHTTTACGDDCEDPTESPLWDSNFIPDLADSPFVFKFNEAGTFLYFCVVHTPTQLGAIIVEGEETPTATATATETSTWTPDEPSTPETPTQTDTPTFTETPVSTSMPLPSTTPDPTATQVPTWTPEPTWTPVPTWTPLASATPTATSTPVLVGDTNCDNAINPLDAALILQLAAGLISALPCPGGGDTNGDGVVDPLDAALVLQFSAGLLDSLPPQ